MARLALAPFLGTGQERCVFLDSRTFHANNEHSDHCSAVFGLFIQGLPKCLDGGLRDFR
jgi:hypothetical protein